MKIDTSLLPQYLYHLIEKNVIEKSNLPFEKKENSGVLFIDISSFTSITEKVSQQGHYGVEIITDILVHYFTEIVDCIHTNNGFLMKYGGDSILAIFPGDISSAYLKMQECVSSITKALEKVNHYFRDNYDITINIHGAASWGEISIAIIGNEKYHLDYYLFGKTLLDAFELGEKAKKNEILFDNLFAENSDSIPNKKLDFTINPAVTSRFIHNSVSRKTAELGLRAELRNTAILFVKLEHKNKDKSISVDEFHQFYTIAQNKVYSLNGSVNKVDFNDKGYIIIITFGTPFMRSNDIERAVLASQRIMESRPANINLKMGITYDNIFAGMIGAPKRYEYGIIGNAVNISARLMSLANLNSITCSDSIKDKIEDYFHIQFVTQTHVKGVKDAINVYEIGEKLPSHIKALQKVSSQELLPSRKKIFNQMLQEIDTHPNSLFTLQGQSGTGKSFFIYHLMESMNKPNMDYCDCSEYERNSSLLLFHKVILNKLKIHDVVQHWNLLSNYLEKNKIAVQLDILHSFFSNSGKEEISNEKRDLIFEMLSVILFQALSVSNLFIIDNVHFMDDSSKKILYKLIPKLLQQNCTIILSFDPSSDIDILKDIDTVNFTLKSLNLKETNSYLTKTVGMFSQKAIKRLHNITHGNLFFLSEMGKKFNQIFDFSNDILNLDSLERLIEDGKIPVALENYFINAYEKMDISLKELIKTAAIVGFHFSAALLETVSKKEIDLISEELQKLQNQDLIHPLSFSEKPEYDFNNHLMQQAIYRIIPKKEKKAIHQKVAFYYKTLDNEPKYIQLIASHYIAAEDKTNISHYSFLAAQKSFSDFSYHTSLYFLKQAFHFARTNEEKQKIMLFQIDNLLKIGDTKKAANLLTLLEDADFCNNNLREQFWYISTRVYFYQTKYHNTIRLVQDIGSKVTNKDVKDKIDIQYLEALRFDNQKDAFESLTNQLETKWTEDKNEPMLNELYGVLGVYHVDQGNYDQAHQFYEKKYKIAEKLNDLFSMRIAIGQLGIISSRKGIKEKALQYYEKALDLAEMIGDKNSISKVLMDMGYIYSNQGENKKAREFYEKSYQMSLRVGNRIQEQSCLFAIGREYHFANDFKQARKYLEQALEICEKIQYQVGISFAQDALGDNYFYSQEFDDSLEMYEKNLTLQKKLNDQEGIAHTYGNLGNIAKDYEKNYKKAIDYYKKQIKILHKIHEPDGEGRAYFNWADAELEQKHFDEALEKLKLAKAKFEECKFKQYIDVANAAIEEVKKMKKEYFSTL